MTMLVQCPDVMSTYIFSVIRQQIIEIWWPLWIMQIRCFPILGFLRTFSMVFWGPHRNSLWQKKFCYNLFQVKPYFAWTIKTIKCLDHYKKSKAARNINLSKSFAIVQKRVDLARVRCYDLETLLNVDVIPSSFLFEEEQLMTKPVKRTLVH